MTVSSRPTPLDILPCVLNTAPGLYRPTSGGAPDWAIDVVDTYVRAQATGQVFDRVLDLTRKSKPCQRGR